MTASIRCLSRPTPTPNIGKRAHRCLAPTAEQVRPAFTGKVVPDAGTQHTGRYGATDAAGPCANLRNPHDPYPAVRALLVALSEWIATGDRHPKAAFRLSAVRHWLATARWCPLTNCISPPCRVSPWHGPTLSSPNGDWVHPTPVESAYVRWCPRWMRTATIAPDCNCRMSLCPSAPIPASTSTKHHFRKARCAIATEASCRSPAAGREMAGDPLRSLVERHGTREHYVAQVTAEASRLVSERLLLPEDAEHYVAEANPSPPSPFHSKVDRLALARGDE